MISHAYVRSANRSVFDCIAKAGYQVSIVAPSVLRSGSIDIPCEPLESNDVFLHELPVSGTHLRKMRFHGLESLMERLSPNIVFVEADPVSQLVFELTRHCRKRGCSLVCLTNENLDWKPLPSLARTGLGRLPTSFAKTLAHFRLRSQIDHVFTTSSYACEIFQRAGYPSVSVLPLGFDSNRFRFDPEVRSKIRKQEGLASDDVVISYFGRVTPEKGVALLVAALGNLKQYSWRLFLNDFVSDSDYSELIGKLIVSQGLAERVHTVRSQHGAIADWMCASDVTVLPSQTTPLWVEQFGRVVTEAMATENYLIVSDSGTPKELVGETGVVFPEGDEKSLTRCLKQFLESPKKYASLRKAASHRANSKYSVDAQARRMVECFERLLGEEDAPAGQGRHPSGHVHDGNET